MRTIRFRLATSCCAALALLSGCVGLGRKYPVKRYYAVEARRQAAARPSPVEAVLKIKRLRVSPLFSDRGFVYRTGELTYESDFYNEFLCSPGDIVTGQVYRWLGACGLFRNVVALGSRVEADLILEGSVAALYGDYRDGESLEAVMEIQFFLLAEAPPEGRVVFHNDYRRAVAAEGTSAEALAGAWCEAMRQILTALEEDLAAVDLAPLR